MKKNTKKMTKMLTGGVLATSLLSPVVASPLTVHAATSASVSDSQSQLPKFTSFTDLPGISDNAYSATKATVSAKTIDNGIIAIQWNGYTNWRDNLVKIDASGKIVSRAVLPDKDFVAKGITQAPDGNFIVVGSTYDWGWNRNWNVITKFDVNGHQIWSTNVPIDMGIGINAVAKTSDGNYIGVGPHGWTKFDDNGKVIWTNFDTQAFTLTSATPTSDGGVIAAGYLASHGSKTSVIVRIDGKGNEVWKKYFNPSVENAFNGIAPTSDGGFVVSGIDREWDLMGMVELQNMTQTETKYGGKK
ncbi:hypothetical protein PP175_26210 (plasmid) [Aneurinibacillus sp. Ricciae_BoGa-3]|uniref:hypothetical protein n=1 Tax=Aneurinibacillus sp. Ricciae_BoGa-3 TaxID=3022697 RepID=UPI002341F417|nr:hypothetical protein [Aneurinibacillus sp. Ricciae_BoGa-3]WCK57562.1 hypothetical protein PP175_26210 [Aneurinibacillus sp. Ricciae_BoGa-3]